MICQQKYFTVLLCQNCEELQSFFSVKKEFEESAFKLMKRMWDQGTEFVQTKNYQKLYNNHLSMLNKKGLF